MLGLQIFRLRHVEYSLTFLNVFSASTVALLKKWDTFLLSLCENRKIYGHFITISRFKMLIFR